MWHGVTPACGIVTAPRILCHCLLKAGQGRTQSRFGLHGSCPWIIRTIAISTPRSMISSARDGRALALARASRSRAQASCGWGFWVVVEGFERQVTTSSLGLRRGGGSGSGEVIHDRLCTRARNSRMIDYPACSLPVSNEGSWGFWRKGKVGTRVSS